MMRSATTLRLFVAVYPPGEVAEVLCKCLESLQLPEHRRIAVAQIHLTLQFIGDVDTRQLDVTIESVQRSSAGLDAFELTPKKMIALPQRGHVRLIATEFDHPATMMEIQRRLAHRLARKPRRKAGDRFLPHMTLARFRTPNKFALTASESMLNLPGFSVLSVKLMRSTLHPDGAVHDVVHEAALRV